ncbi:MAG TPA: tRNA (adenosine(37)-N6)-threonylcarbamoyltransferase complex transferase subunit TsaD [Mariprofundaceae bacterium]|nr:tRNA (adenosine(37)-N6)-threonylcarbamoyltransferase complex transferase subunit TsaD [Mariprofundaceae bacterium]
MIILGIETSCDETAAAVYRGGAHGNGEILAERVASQIKTHARYGGVVPEVASREHLQLLPPMVDDLLQELAIAFDDLDAIGVTAGPGLMGALLVGVSYARALGEATGIPVIPVHHMEGHLLAPGLSGQLPEFPFITLLVSGGHTLLVKVDGIGNSRVIGQTLDDAAGECFDKCARLLGLPYPGGPEIARLAERGDAKRYELPRPMLHKDDLNFSFSGLKTAVMYKVRELGALREQERCDLAASIEAAICEVLARKSLRACQREAKPRLVIGGGVASNSTFRGILARLASREGIEVYMPDPHHCTDNAAMIAHAAYYSISTSVAMPEAWDVQARWPL